MWKKGIHSITTVAGLDGYWTLRLTDYRSTKIEMKRQVCFLNEGMEGRCCRSKEVKFQKNVMRIQSDGWLACDEVNAQERGSSSTINIMDRIGLFNSNFILHRIISSLNCFSIKNPPIEKLHSIQNAILAWAGSTASSSAYWAWSL